MPIDINQEIKPKWFRKARNSDNRIIMTVFFLALD